MKKLPFLFSHAIAVFHVNDIVIVIAVAIAIAVVIALYKGIAKTDLNSPSVILLLMSLFR